MISGLDDVPAGVEVLHAGTAEDGDGVVTAGGRVLNVTALGDDVRAARDAAYAAADMIEFDGRQLRRDIALQGMSEQPAPPISPPRRPSRPSSTGMEVDAPRVGIVMGSKSDMPAMEKAAKELEERGIRHEVRVMSAHRDPDTVADYAKNAKMRGLRVIIAGAGLSAALPGVVAAHSQLPVIGVPLTSSMSVARRARRAALDRPDAARRAGGVRGRRQREERRGARGAHPRLLTRG